MVFQAVHIKKQTMIRQHVIRPDSPIAGSHAYFYMYSNVWLVFFCRMNLYSSVLSLRKTWSLIQLGVPLSLTLEMKLSSRNTR